MRCIDELSTPEIKPLGNTENNWLLRTKFKECNQEGGGRHSIFYPLCFLCLVSVSRVIAVPVFPPQSVGKDILNTYPKLISRVEMRRAE